MSNRPYNTFHLYEESEMISMQVNGSFMKKIPDCLFATMERDLSGHGNAAFSTNIQTCIEKVVLVKPSQIYTLLKKYNQYTTIMKNYFNGSTGRSFTNEEARQLLVNSSLLLCTLDQSKEFFSMMQKSFMKNLNQEYSSALVDCKWLNTLTEPKKNTKTQSSIPPQWAGNNFRCALRESTLAWIKVYSINPSDTNSKEWVEATEEAHKLDLSLVLWCQAMIAMEYIEKRKVEDEDNSIIVAVLKEFDDKVFKPNFPKLHSKGLKPTKSVILRSFDFLFENVNEHYETKKNKPNLVLLSILEFCMRDVVDAKSAFIVATLVSARQRALDFKDNGNAEYDTPHSEVTSILEQYESSIEDGAMNAEKLIKGRLYSVDDVYLDDSTFRGKGKDTSALFMQGIEKYTIAMADLPDGEISRSHGPPRTEAIPRDANASSLIKILKANYHHWIGTMPKDKTAVTTAEDVVVFKKGSNPSGLKKGSLLRIKKIVYEEYNPDTMDIDMEQYNVSTASSIESSTIEDDDDDDNNKNKKKKADSNDKKKRKSSKNEVDAVKPKKKKKLQEDDNKKVQAPRKQKKVVPANIDILKLVQYECMSQEEKDALKTAPLAQRPTCNSKKLVRVVGGKVYKGPYDPTIQKDIESIQRVLYRTFRMKECWNDSILLDQRVLLDEDNKKLYLASTNFGKHHDVKYVESTLKTHEGATVGIVDDSFGCSKLTKVLDTIATLDQIVSPALCHLASRYIIGSGGGHFGEIIVNDETYGIASMDLEDNREDVPTTKEHTFAIFSSENDSSKKDDVCQDPKIVSLLECLFVKSRQPPFAKNKDKFYSLLPSKLDDLLKFVCAIEKEDLSKSKNFAESIGYKNPVPDSWITDRIETLKQILTYERPTITNADQNLSV